jgi:hypothetical protein
MASYILSVSVEILLESFLYSIYNNKGAKYDYCEVVASDYFRWVMVCIDCFDNLLRPGFLLALLANALMVDGPDIFSFKYSFLKKTLMDFLEFLFTATGWSFMFFIDSKIFLDRRIMFYKSKGSCSSWWGLRPVQKKSLK